jgi:ribosome-associated protein
VDDDILRINDQVSIPLAELSFRFSRSSGPGGQHVQKSSTRVELLFDAANSPSLSDAQRSRVLKRLAGYIDTTGVLHLTSQSERSQLRNREAVVSRFQSMMREVLKRRKRRRPTRPTAQSRERRLRKKKERSQIKKGRRKVRDYD